MFATEVNNVSFIACRSQAHLQYEDKGGNVVIIRGPFSNIIHYWVSPTGPGNKTSPNYAGDDASDDFALLLQFWPQGTYNTFEQAILDLGGNAIKAQGSLMSLDGFSLQMENNLTAQSEMTRWFGIVMLDYLYRAEKFTSGQSNYGFGTIEPLGANGQQHYLCTQTLHTTTQYQSANLILLIILVAGCLVVIAVSYSIVSALYWLVATRKPRIPATIRPDQTKHSFREQIQRALVANDLHHLNQLYRIAVEKTWGNYGLFKKTLGSLPVPVPNAPSPGYGFVRIATGERREEYADSDAEGALHATITQGTQDWPIYFSKRRVH